MKQVYQADDGTIFDTEAECKAYENADALHALHNLIRDNIGVSYDDDAGFHCIEIDDVKTFIYTHIDGIIRIVKGGTVVTGAADEGWISNEGNNSSHPPESLTPETKIEIKLRNGTTQQGNPGRWTLGWKSVDKDEWDIVAYRIVT